MRYYIAAKDKSTNSNIGRQVVLGTVLIDFMEIAFWHLQEETTS